MKILLPLFALTALTAFGVSSAHAQKVNPKLVSAPSPGYPEELTDTGLSGKAEVDITVKADGSVADPQLAMATERAFGRAAMAGVVQWKFEPGQRDGVAVDMRVSIPFVYTAPADQVINAVAKRKVFVTLAEPALTQKDYGSKLKVKKPARPVYPRGATGDSDVTVQVKFVIGPDGSTLNPAVVGTVPKEFVSPALQAVALMAYEPVAKDGKPVYVETTTKLDFSIERRGGGDGGMGGGGGRRGGGGGGGGGRGGGGGMGGGGFGGEGPGG